MLDWHLEARMLARFLLLSLAIVSPVVAARGQLLDLEKNRVPVAELNCLWRFHTGDDANWADPSFDDSQWSLLRADRSYFEQGFNGYSGLAWYRVQVVLPQRPHPLALLVPYLADAFEVYVNGHLIGGAGSMPPHPKPVLARSKLFSIAANDLVPGKPQEIAIRVWRWPGMASQSGGGLVAPPFLGDETALSRLQTLQNHDLFWHESVAVLGFFANLLTAIASLALFALRRKEREYLWFGLAQVLWAAQLWVSILWASQDIAYIPLGIAGTSFMTLAKFFNLEFFVTLLGQRRRSLYWAAFSSNAARLLLILFAGAGWIGGQGTAPVTAGLEFVYGICVPAMLLMGVRQGGLEARLLIAPFTLSFACNVIGPLLYVPALASHPWAQAFADRFRRVVSWPLPMNAADLAGDLAMFSVVAVLVLRFARSRRDEERLAAELEAARAVQHVLVPDEIPSIPGFQIECIYKPAGEVGGDFFQVLPLPEGGALIAIGDVSGKGMPAAMTVSMLVGMVRMLTRATHRPSEILDAVNQSMMGRTSGGFTTCLILHITSNGVLTASNAGHVPPYVEGKEMKIESGLPLGIESSAAYMETTLQLAPDDRVTLLTDGVVEARAADGELFGFERAASISARPAAEIAAAAQRFGQEDDITVLSLTRRASNGEASRRLDRPAWSQAPA